jgi:hypothetical protein
MLDLDETFVLETERPLADVVLELQQVLETEWAETGMWAYGFPQYGTTWKGSWMEVFLAAPITGGPASLVNFLMSIVNITPTFQPSLKLFLVRYSISIMQQLNIFIVVTRVEPPETSSI